jgi:hypothetical protein
MTLNYQVAVAGTYYVVLRFASGGVNYNLTVDGVGTPIGVSNPAVAGCLQGQVDYITYSLQLIAADLPDVVSIGGTQLCATATCVAKPPLYSQIVAKLERALSTGLPVEACYDGSRNVFQITLKRP